MANLILGYPNQANGATLSGGTFSTSLPITNLQDYRISKKARTTGLGVSRAATATYVNSSGLLATAPANTLRFDYSDTGLTNPVPLVEEAATQGLLASNVFTTWSVNGTATATSAVGVSPTGASDANKVASYGAANDRHAIYQTLSGAASFSWTCSAYFKASEYPLVCLTFEGTSFVASGAIGAIFDLTTGTKVVTSGVTAFIQKIGNNGWYRCAIAATTLSVVGTSYFYIQPLPAGSTTIGGSYTPASVGGVWLFGGQIEQGLKPSSYIPSSGSYVTRDKDVLAPSVTITLDKNRPISIVAIVGHNLSPTAKMRVLGNDSSNFLMPDYDTGWLDVWTDTASSKFGTLAWEDDSFWTWKISNEEAKYYPGLALATFTTDQALQYWRIDFYDPNNTDGYIDMGRLFIGDYWQVTTNTSYGWNLGYEDQSIIESSIGGAEYFDTRPRYRVLKLGLDYLTSSEALSMALGVGRTLGTTGEVLVVWDRDDYDNLMRRSFLGRLRTLNPIENPDPVRYTTAFEIKETIA